MQCWQPGSLPGADEPAIHPRFWTEPIGSAMGIDRMLKKSFSKAKTAENPGVFGAKTCL